MAFAYPNVPGLGFYPTDEQICVYLKRKIEEHGRGYPNSMSGFFPDIDLCQFKPSELAPLIEGLTMGDDRRHEWYFFRPRKERRSGSNRTVPYVGSWKVTGKKQNVINGITGEEMGTKSIVVFYPSSSSALQENGSWVIHEYNLNPSYLGNKEISFVACCLKKKACDGSPGEGSSHDIYSCLSPIQSLD